MTHAEQDALFESLGTTEWTKTVLDRPDNKTEAFTAAYAGYTISLTRITIRELSACYGVVAHGKDLRVMNTETAVRLIAALETSTHGRPA